MIIPGNNIFLGYVRLFLSYLAPTACLANYSDICVHIFWCICVFSLCYLVLLRFLANHWYICVVLVSYLRLFPFKVWILTPKSNRQSAINNKKHTYNNNLQTTKTHMRLRFRFITYLKHCLPPPHIWRFLCIIHLKRVPIVYLQHSRPVGFITFPKHAAHLAIPAVIYLKDHRPPPIGRCQFFMGFIIYLKHPPWGDSGLSYIFKHAPHLAIPAIIYLKHAPRLGDSGSSYTFKHAPHLVIPAIIYLQHARPVGFIVYLKHAPRLGDSGSS